MDEEIPIEKFEPSTETNHMKSYAQESNVSSHDYSCGCDHTCCCDCSGGAGHTEWIQGDY
jgi:hypothetical protein